MENSEVVGNYIMNKLEEFSSLYKIRGKGLMIGIEFNFPIAEFRKKLLFEYGIFTGVSGQNIIRLLPPLSLTIAQAKEFLSVFKKVFTEITVSTNEH